MSLVGKNRAVFSYKNQKLLNRNFLYKDFEKTKSYRTNFSNSKFGSTSFRAAHFKYCSFLNCSFADCDFIGTNFRGSYFSTTTFENCIFSSVVFDQVKFKNTSFKNCYFFGSSAHIQALLSNMDGNTVLPAPPAQNTVSPALKEVIDSLRTNDIIRRSHTLHGKGESINTSTLLMLHSIYTDEQLITLLPLIHQFITTQFYTISYLKMLLKKAAAVL